MIYMMNTMNLQYARVEHTSEYPDQFNEAGLIIVWMNPYYMRGKPQLNRWVYPLTNEGKILASKDAKYINEKIRKEVEETTSMRKGLYN